MMIANSSNLIITVKPANQRATAPRRGSFSRNSQLSSGSHQSTQSVATGSASDEEADEIVDLTGVTIHDDVSTSTTTSTTHHLHHPSQNHFSHDQTGVLHL